MRSKIIALLVAGLALSCSPQRLYLETRVVYKADSNRVYVKKISQVRLKPGVLKVGDTLRGIVRSTGPTF